jgi:hypothetical protein
MCCAPGERGCFGVGWLVVVQFVLVEAAFDGRAGSLQDPASDVSC